MLVDEEETKTQIKLFEEQKVHTVWDSEKEEWYFSVVDVVGILTESENPRNYWKVLKHRLSEEGSQLVTNCNQLKMPAADGKMYKTDCMTTGQVFRLIQSIPSPKAEPFKLWMAQVAKEYKEFKGLKKENLRDNMTNKELVLNMLAELSTKEISESKNPKSFGEHIQNAVDGATIAKNARAELEQKTGKKVVTPLNAKDGIGLIQDTKLSVLEEDEESK